VIFISLNFHLFKKIFFFLKVLDHIFCCYYIKIYFNPLRRLNVVTSLPSTESRIYSRCYRFLLLLHCIFRDNVLPVMLCCILYTEAFPRSRLPLAHIFLAIFLWKDRTLWISEVGTTLKRSCSVSCYLLVASIFMASDLLNPPTSVVKNSMGKRMLSSSRN